MEATIDKCGRSTRWLIDQEHPELTSNETADGLIEMRRHAGGRVAPFLERRLSQGNRRQAIAHPLGDVVLQFIAYGVRTPLGLAQQALHAVGSAFCGIQGQAAPVFAFQWREQPVQIAQCPLARLSASEVTADARV
jgi:hypothetical protein